MSDSNLSLQNLVEAIMNSIADAQEQIERQTLDDINEWFDEEGRPKMANFKLPSLHPDDFAKRANGETVDRDVQVPLLTLMQKNPIKIKKLMAKFDVSLGGVNVTEEDLKQGGKPLIGSEKPKRTRKVLSTGLFTGGKGKSGTSAPQQASMEIEFESGEPTEAFLKLQNDLLKLF